MYQALVDYIRDKKILILGFGREGRSSYFFIKKHLPDKALTVADKNKIELDDENVSLICGENYLDCINDYDLVLKSPGIPFVGLDINENVEISCQTDLFLRFIDCKSAGVTGTKGKTTTSTLIYEMLKASGIDCCLIGNVGVPVFESIEDIKGKTAVVELSSHQLEFMHVSPDVAVLTNIYEEHLDHYDGFGGYVSAKLNIVRNQTAEDTFIVTDHQDISEFIDLSQVKPKIIKIGKNEDEKNEFFASLCGINDRLIGRHNYQDIFFAATAAILLGADKESIKRAVENFKGIEHRLEPVGEVCGVKFYNDSIATMPHAVMCNIEALGDTDTLIFGGLDRGLDYSDFCVQLEKCEVRNLIGLPETGHNICNDMEKSGTRKTLVKAADMEDAVKQAFELTQKGKSCLMSPAAASYNIYKDFSEKGRHFKDLVLARKQS